MFTGNHTAQERLAYTVEEAARLLGISRTSAYLAAQRGELPSVLIGRRRLVPREALDRFLASNTPTAAPVISSPAGRPGLGYGK